MFSFALDYYLAVFVAAVGVIQIAASAGGLRGLQLFPSRIAATVLGIALVAAAPVGFFTTATRNINDYEGGLDANEQAIYLWLGVLSAVGFTFALSSLVNIRMRYPARAEPPVRGEPVEPLSNGYAAMDGLEALKRTTYMRAAMNNLSYWSRRWRTQIKPYLLG